MNHQQLHHPPYFIVFEGLDGSGKSTTARRCAERLGARYMTTPSPSVREYRESLIDALGCCPEAPQLFYMATVFAASQEIGELLAAGESVVLDRYYLSTQAYAQFRGSTLDLDTLSNALRPATLTVFLDAPLHVRRERVVRRGASRADRETLSPEADRQLRALHFQRRELAVVGELLTLDSHAHEADACVDLVLAKLCR
jgi:dTMP kinase